MEKPLFPCEYIRITQGYGEGTHLDSYAIDNAGKDSGISDIYAPYTGIIKKIYTNDANEVWLESVEKVEFPDGTIDYMTMLFAHNDDISDLFVGKRINKGEAFYKEGKKGNTTGNHCHIECGKGKFIGTGWHKNNAGYWSINNAKKPEECLWIDNTIKILDNYKYNFKIISTQPVDKIDAITHQSVEINTDNNLPKYMYKTKKEFVARKTDLYGIFLKENDKLIIQKLS